MITTTWTKSPADLLGMGGSALRECTGLDSRTVIGVSPAPRVAPIQGTGVPAAGAAVRLRAQLQNETHNFIGTTLGIHPSGRPLS
jgi:hypothetical protein